MAFADVYPLSLFASIADVSWWRASDFDRPRPRRSTDHPSNEEASSVPTREARKLAADLDTADKARLDQHKEQFEACILQHLEGLRGAGKLGKTGGLAGREVRLAEAWNHFVDGKPDSYETKHLLHHFTRQLVRAIVDIDAGRYSRKSSPDYVPGTHRKPSEGQILAAWSKLCGELDTGTSDPFSWPIEIQDQKTGDRCELHFTNWQAQLMRRTRDHKLEVAPDCGPIPLASAVFPIPTGRLLLTDTLRVPGFSDGTDFGDREYDDELSLNSELGCVNRTSVHAKDHGFGYCQTTNTCVSVHRHPKTHCILITPRWMGEEWEEDADGDAICPGWEKLGSFSCDIWRITAIDFGTAVLRMKDGGCDTPEATLTRYLGLAKSDNAASANARQAHHEQAYSRNIVEVAVQTGDMRIHCGPDFGERVDRARYDIPHGVNPWALLEPIAAT